MKTNRNDCRDLSFAVETYLDGELEPSQVVEVESHMSHCGTCRERVSLDRAVRASLQQLARPSAPSSLRERMEARLQAERLRNERLAESQAEAAPESSSSEHRASFPLRYATPFAVAAGFALFFSVAQRAEKGLDTPTNKSARTEVARASVGLDGLLDDLVHQHAEPLPPEVTKPEQVALFDPFVGVPTQGATPKLAPFGATFVGGRIMAVQDKRAAMMQYKFAGNHRVTVYVYDPRRITAESQILRKQNVRNAPVYVGSHLGYNVAATEKQGIGYALASDLGDDESAELVAAAAVP